MLKYSSPLFRSSFCTKWSTPKVRDTITCVPRAILSAPRFHSTITARIDEERGARTYRHGQRMVRAPRGRNARPLSRERSKSKPTSQPIVNTGTTGEFNSIRTRSSDCSIVRHRIPPTRSCGLFPLYLSLSPRVQPSAFASYPFLVPHAL